MDLSIVKGDHKHLKDCAEAVVHSELGKVYYVTKESAQGILREGIERQEIYVALNGRSECVGFIWFAAGKMFYKFPYVRLIGVKREFRGHGIGRKLLSHVERIAFNEWPKLFLTVSEFNTRAKKLYENTGYQQVGFVPDLFTEGVAEYVMVKLRPEI
jgi:ribosomal protein S18 acetylase RimI-like enzyme